MCIRDSFDERSLQISFYDQLRSPNSEETFGDLQSDIGAAVAAAYGDAVFEQRRVSETATEALTVEIALRETVPAA